MNFIEFKQINNEEGVMDMSEIEVNKCGNSTNESDFLHLLDKGIEDMEEGNELSLKDAFQKIKELRGIRSNAGV